MKQTLLKHSAKLRILALAGFLTFSLGSVAQITLEQSYPYSGTFALLEKEGPKFYLMDVAGKECRLYNLDYSPYKTIVLDVPADNYLYDIQFVTQNLFDNDDGVELMYVFYRYVQTSTGYYYIYTTRIADEDGSVLLDVPGGSWSDITNISGSGSRLMTWVTDYSVYPYPVETRIYSLPGQVSGLGTETAPFLPDEPVYPNPTSGMIRTHPGEWKSADRAEWVILDSAGKLIARVPAQSSGNAVDLKALGLVAGTYLIRMESKNYQTKFQQVVLNN
jgi:hypothetical protein